jgi:hypothetical protein
MAIGIKQALLINEHIIVRQKYIFSSSHFDSLTLVCLSSHPWMMDGKQCSVEQILPGI